MIKATRLRDRWAAAAAAEEAGASPLPGSLSNGQRNGEKSPSVSNLKKMFEGGK